MSDTVKPIAVPVHNAPWQPSDAQIVAANEAAWAKRMLAQHDAARASMGKTVLTAVTDFNIVDDDNPDGRVVKMGEEFTVSDFDLPRFLGKGLPRA